VLTKKIQKKIPKFFFTKQFPQQIFKKFKKKILFFLGKIKKLFCLNSYACNRGSACEKCGGLGPLVWEEIENAQTVHKGLAKLLYRLELFGW
jgi:hypothetical protein